MNVRVIDMSVTLDKVWGVDQRLFDITLLPVLMSLDSWRWILYEIMRDIEIAYSVSLW